MRTRDRLVAVRSRRLIAIVTVVLTVAIVALTASLGGAAAHKTVPLAAADTPPPATGIAGLIAQVQDGFAGGLIQSASVNGTGVDATLGSPNEASATVAAFEAEVLAHAVADWQSAHGESPATSLTEVGPNGQPITGMPTELIGGDSNSSPLSSGTCESAAQETPANVVVVSAATLPYAGGTCIYTLKTSGDPNAATQSVVSAMSNVIPVMSNYPYLIEVEDMTGTPQIILTWVPGSGDGHGEGSAYVRPGLSSPIHG